MKKHIFVYTCLLFATSISRQDEIFCKTSNIPFYYRIHDNSYRYCYTCTEFTLTEGYLEQLRCITDQNIIGKSYFNDVRRQCSYCEAVSVRTNIGGTTILKNDLSWRWEKLKLLDISGNLLKNITPHFLNSFNSLLSLDLSNNIITSVSNDEFFALTKLQKLNLSRNSINNLNDPFKSLIDLFEIDLSYNKISQIPSNMFQSQGHLEVLLINNNDIVNFDGIFRNSTPFSLPFIDLSWNKIQTLHLQGNFRNLNISHNKLSEFSVNLSSSLLFLNLSHNNLNKISEYNMLQATNLIELDLSSNQLESLPTSSFRYQKSLQYINIANNLLKNFKYGSEDNWVSFFLHFDNLKKVSLDNNMWTCTDLLNIIHSLKSSSVKIVPGNEHAKDNLLGIACMNNTNINLSYSTVDVNSNLDNMVLNEVRSHLENNTNKVAEVATRVNDLETKISNLLTQKELTNNLIKGQNASMQAMETIILNKVLSKLKYLNTQNRSIQTQKDNNSLTNKETPDLELIKYLNENSDLLRSRVKEEMNKTEQSLQINVAVGANAISGEIIQNLLLLSVLFLLLYFLYTVLKRKKFASPEAIDLVQT